MGGREGTDTLTPSHTFPHILTVFVTVTFSHILTHSHTFSHILTVFVTVQCVHTLTPAHGHACEITATLPRTSQARSASRRWRRARRRREGQWALPRELLRWA